VALLPCVQVTLFSDRDGIRKCGSVLRKHKVASSYTSGVPQASSLLHTSLGRARVFPLGIPVMECGPQLTQGRGAVAGGL